jgi:hypothetical protein
MSKKSVVINLPPRAAAGPAQEPREAEGWIKAETAAPPEPRSEGFGQIDLTAPRSPFELAMLIWSFPALATLHWMAKATEHPRPR